MFRAGIPDAALILALITAKSSELDVKKLGLSFQSTVNWLLNLRPDFPPHYTLLSSSVKQGLG